ncbi:MAG: zf-TFIIB domain-containing protein [Terracidiphilus sp.]
MNCPSCGAPMRLKPDEDSLTCDYCRSVYFPEKNDDGVRVLGEVSDQACPLCKIPLTQAAIVKMRILYCTGCRGMLISMPTFEGIVEEMRAIGGGMVVQPVADKGDLQRRVDCPHCHKRMDTHFYAGPGNVVVDSCSDCSLIWLDRGELMHIAHAPDEPLASNEWE